MEILVVGGGWTGWYWRSWQLLVSGISAGTPLFLSSRPYTFKSAYLSREMLACIWSSQDTTVSSLILLQVGFICSQAKTSASKYSWALPFKGKKQLQINALKGETPQSDADCLMLIWDIPYQSQTASLPSIVLIAPLHLVSSAGLLSELDPIMTQFQWDLC